MVTVSLIVNWLKYFKMVKSYELPKIDLLMWMILEENNRLDKENFDKQMVK